MRNDAIRIALVGVGKIARDQHLPALADNPDFALLATVDPYRGVDGAPNFATLEALLAAHSVDAVSICTPPGVRAPIVAAAIDAGLHVMMEKPPAATVADVETLATRAANAGVSLFATWHSREASGVAPAREWLRGKRIDRVTVTWKEDIRRWHPGQDWILGPDGFGVFDPGINALSIVTALLPDPLTIDAARLAIPEDRASPIAATLAMTAGAATVAADFDFLQSGEQTWDIVVDTNGGVLTLREGGNVLAVDGRMTRGADQEYIRLYRQFADLIARGESDVDTAPLRLVTDALRIGDRTSAPLFDW
ncbi:Gfo/Idh/MocA family oxidoreductase [Sphingomonas sp. SUN019]|uniref:Gfo/Idh/MocA family protein n=1 Tax=Sphingomonas sp. SUN019 TaxID=2937788 RepID=UPI0021640188|nr:Gfo/Idh/MocA family oxidoreductase [Sphingomonas sp. SUN019]UVO50234.1 Gfo/Idh/MocA family oxidoreductase [Sphingomonas sp. SUN019]